MIKWDKIPNTKNLIRSLKVQLEHGVWEQETLDFLGTVKVHGTNAGVRLESDGSMFVQSRNMSVPIDMVKDGFNMGLGGFIKEREAEFRAYLETVIGDADSAVLFGEFCGPGILKGTGIQSTGRKRMLVFNVSTVKDGVQSRENVNFELVISDVHSMVDFGVYHVQLDLDNLDTFLDRVNSLVELVENECPVAKYFGTSGIGEGLVFKCVQHPEIMFKAKGEKHKKANTVKERKEKDQEAWDFVASVVTPERVEQGAAYLENSGFELSKSSTGAFLKYVTADCLEEIEMEMEDAGMTVKRIGKPLNTLFREAFFTYLEENY